MQDQTNTRKIQGRTGLPIINVDISGLTIIGWEGYTGRLSRREMFREMSKHSIGLLPWKKHWSHGFVCPDRIAHAGLFVGCTSFETVLRTLRDNCISFEDYSDLVSIGYLRQRR